jgi:hypothetical protein
MLNSFQHLSGRVVNMPIGFACGMPKQVRHDVLTEKADQMVSLFCYLSAYD